jgi:hypothetical protein
VDLGPPFSACFHPARAFFLRRGLFILLAFDAWLVMLEHGGRYGAGDFNVAHFTWVDALVGVPSAGLYVGLLIVTGWLAFALAVVRACWFEKAVLAGLYTASWAISLHDSYQHHYLLSWLLAFCACVPEPKLEDCVRPQAERIPAVGLSLTYLTCAIVYVFTAISKSSHDWRSGAVLARLSHSRPPGASVPGVLDGLRDWLTAELGFSQQQVFECLAASLIALQLLVALGYLVSPGRDEARRSFRPLLAGLGLACACAFHLGAELSGIFEIGWFSYYMLWIGVVLLAPSRWLAWSAAGMDRCASWFVSRLHIRRVPGSRPVWGWRALLLVVALGACGGALDLPGAMLGCGIVGGLGALALWRAARREDREALRSRLLAGLLACAALWAAIGLSSVRFDFYRLWAGELARMGELQRALTLYRKAETYAPAGKSRASQIERLERELSGGGSRTGEAR